MKNICLLSIGLFLVFFSFGQSWDWVQTVGLGGNNYVWDLEHDSENNVIATGRVKGTVQFGLDPDGEEAAPIGAETDVFVVKFDAQGNLVWWKREGEVNPDWGRSIDVDKDDNIYVTGDFCNVAVFEDDTIYGYDNGATSPNSMARSGFLAKYDPDGNLQWVKSFQGEGHCKSFSVTVDGNGTSYITGYVQGEGQFDAYITGTTGTTSAFYAKYDTDGNCVWAKSAGASSGMVGNDIKVVDDENFVLTGYYKGTMTIDGDSYSGSSSTWGDFFLASLDSSGNLNWNNVGGGPFFVEGYDIVVDSMKNIFLLGHFAYECDFGTDTTLVAIGGGATTGEKNFNWDSFLCKYDVDGNYEWVNQIGNDAKTQFDAVELIDEKEVIVAGYSIDSIFVESDTLIPVEGNHNTMIISYDKSEGQYKWNKMIGSEAPVVPPTHPNVRGNAPKGIAVDDDFNIYFGGYYDDKAIWDTTEIIADNGWDAWIAKLYPQPNADLQVPFPVCHSDTNLFVADAWGSPLSYTWTSDDGTFIGSSSNDSAYVQFDIAGLDSVTCIVSNGYATDTSWYIVDIILPFVELGEDYETCDDSEVIDAAGDGQFFDWGTGFIENDSIYVASSTGSYSVTVMDTNGCTASDTIYIEFKDCADLETYSFEFEVYPNPVVSDLNIKTTSGESFEVMLYDNSGKLVYQKKTKGNQIITTDHFDSGLYTLVLLGRENVFKTKFIKQ